MKFTFSREVTLEAGFVNWSGENEGALKLGIEFWPSEETLNQVGDEDELYFGWFVVSELSDYLSMLRRL